MPSLLDDILYRHFMNRNYEGFAKYARVKIARMKKDKAERDTADDLRVWHAIRQLSERKRIESKDQVHQQRSKTNE